MTREVRRGDNNKLKEAVPAQFGRPIVLFGGDNNSGDVEVQAQDWTHSSTIYPMRFTRGGGGGCRGLFGRMCQACV